MAAVSFEGVTKTYPDGTTAVDGLDLDASPLIVAVHYALTTIKFGHRCGIAQVSHSPNT